MTWHDGQELPYPEGPLASRSVVSEARPKVKPVVHYQSRTRMGKALCGADVIGILTNEPNDCPVCADLKRSAGDPQATCHGETGHTVSAAVPVTQAAVPGRYFPPEDGYTLSDPKRLGPGGRW